MNVQGTHRHSRILFVADRACGSPSLCSEVRLHAKPGADVFVVAPVRSSTRHSWISDEADDRKAAEQRLAASIRCLRQHGLRARGTLGDADPVQAVEDAVYAFPADEIVICLEEPERAQWRRKHVVDRTRERFTVPVTEVTVAERDS